jgi:tetratricopeptide (TPR) repeat protein
LNNLAVGMLNEDLREAARLLDEAVELSRRTGNLGSATYFQGGNLYTLLLLGRWGEIEGTIAELADTNPPDANVLEFLQGKAVYEAFRGEDKAAAATLQTIHPLLAEASLPDIAVYEKLIEAQIQMAAGRLEAGHRLAVAGMVLRGSGLEFYCAEWATRAGLWMGDESRVREAVERLHAVRPHGRVPRTMARQMDAAIAALDGHHSEALEGYREALEVWREMEVPFIRGLCLMDMVAVIAPSVPEAAAAADEARSLWTRLGAPPLLARLDELLARWEAHDGDGDESRQTETAGRRSSAVPRSG